MIDALHQVRQAGLTCGLLVLLAACGADATPLSPSGFRGVDLATPLPVPELMFTDTDGEPWSLATETADRVALFFFGYTNCPDICPVHLANLAAVLDRMPDDLRRQVMVVFITTDPARDSLPRLRAWVKQFDRQFVGLTASDSVIFAAELAMGIPRAFRDSSTAGSEYLVQHAGQVVAATRDGMLRVAYPFGTRQRDWAHDLPLLVAHGD
jgi:protein SCO1/2